MVSICIKDNNPHIQNFLQTELNNASIPNIYYSKHNFKIYENTIVHYLGENTKQFYNFLANAISNAIIKFYEPKIIKRLITAFYIKTDFQIKINKNKSLLKIF